MVVRARRCSRTCIYEDFEKGVTERTHVVVHHHTGLVGNNTQTVVSKCVAIHVCVQRQTLVSILHAMIDILLGCRAMYFWYIDNNNS